MRTLQSPILIRNIAKNLVLKRMESGLTQTQVAQTLGVTFQQAQKFESGNNAMRADQLHIVCKKYNWNIESFFHTPISIKQVIGFYSDDDKQGQHVFARKRRGKKRSGYDILKQEGSDSTRPLDTYTSNGKVLTITQDVSGPYEGTPAGTTKEWLRNLPTGTALSVLYVYNATFDPRFVKDD